MGALTSKPYAFVARSWELKSVESIDVFDSHLGSVRYDYRGGSILRVLPVLNEALNQEWITDKVRFFYDAIQNQRITTPWVRASLIFPYLNSFNISCQLVHLSNQFSVSWVFSIEVFAHAAYKLINSLNPYLSSTVSFIGGPITSLETISAAQLLINRFGFNALTVSEILNSPIEYDSRSYFTVNQKSVLSSDSLFLVAFNPRLESPVFNLKLRELVLSGKTRIFTFLSSCILNYRFVNLGFSFSKFFDFLSGRSVFSTRFLNFNFPVFLLGSSLVTCRFSISTFLSYFKNLKLLLPTLELYFYPAFASSINSLELGCSAYSHGYDNALNIIYSMSFDDLDFESYDLSFADHLLSGGNSVSVSRPLFYIYQGSHGDTSASMAHIVFPSAAHTETNSTYVSVYSSIRKNKLVLPPANSLVRSDSSILNTVKSAIISISRFHPTFPDFEVNSHSIDLPFRNFFISTDDLFLKPFRETNVYSSFSFLTSLISDFYMTDSISRSSKHLSLAAGLRSSRVLNFN